MTKHVLPTIKKLEENFFRYLKKHKYLSFLTKIFQNLISIYKNRIYLNKPRGFRQKKINNKIIYFQNKKKPRILAN